MPTSESDLAVAVAGPTGTFGFGLVPQLEADRRIGHVVGFARRPFDPAEHGWSKMTYRRGDVRDPATLEQRSQAPTSSSTSPSRSRGRPPGRRSAP